MLQEQPSAGFSKTNLAFLFASKPTAPVITNFSAKERKGSDPSANVPGERSYPIPAFFEYRAKPRDIDSI
jgi:hypothetical protein